MNKFIPLALASLKDTTGIVELCKKAGEPVVVNRNGELKNPSEIVKLCESTNKPFWKITLLKGYFPILKFC